MSTPLSINFVLLTYFRPIIKSASSTRLSFSMSGSLDKVSELEDVFKPDVKPQEIKSSLGIVIKDGNPVSMYLLELQEYMNSHTPNALSYVKSWTSQNTNVFRSICNGIFQAEGHIGGSFTNPVTLTVRPVWSISQNASTDSIWFFSVLSVLMENQGVTTFRYHYAITSSGYWHIRLYTRSWKDILTILMPYFYELRGAKWNAFIRLSTLYRLSLTSPRTQLDRDYFVKKSIPTKTQIDILY